MKRASKSKLKSKNCSKASMIILVILVICIFRSVFVSYLRGDPDDNGLVQEFETSHESVLQERESVIMEAENDDSIPGVGFIADTPDERLAEDEDVVQKDAEEQGFIADNGNGYGLINETPHRSNDKIEAVNLALDDAGKDADPSEAEEQGFIGDGTLKSRKKRRRKRRN